MYLVLSAFTSRPISLLTSIEASVFLYSMHAFTEYNNAIVIKHKLIFTCCVEIRMDDPPIVSSTYEVNLDSRMLVSILYVVGKSDMSL